MTSVIILKLVLLLFLFMSSAFFASSETALFSLSKIQLQKLKESKKKSVKYLLRFLSQPRKILATILLGNEVTNVSISIVMASLVYDTFKVGFEISTIISVSITTMLILIFGETLPKNIAIRYAPSLAPVIVVPLRFFYNIVAPVRRLLSGMADWIVKMFGGSPGAERPVIWEDEFRYMVDLVHKEGEIEKEERELIHKVFDFGDKIVKDIMVPKEKIFSLEAKTPYERLIDSLKATQFSRVPIHQDNKDNIIGILYLKDLFRFHKRKRVNSETKISDILRPVIYVNPDDKLEHLMKIFQQQRIHIAMVVDKSPNVLGLVTMDDVLEELFGKMRI